MGATKGFPFVPVEPTGPVISSRSPLQGLPFRIGQNPVERRHSDLQPPARLALADPRAVEVFEYERKVLRHVRTFDRLRPSEVPAVSTGIVQPLPDSLRNEATLELRNGSEHCQEEPSRRTRRVDLLREARESDAVVLPLFQRSKTVESGPEAAVELPREHMIHPPVPDVREQADPLGPVKEVGC